METINNYIKTEMPRIINIITELFTTPLGYIILGVLIILTLLLIKYHELVEGTKCYSALLPLPLIKEYLIIKITTGKIFAKLYVIIIIVTTIMKQLPINEYVIKSINITNKILNFFLIINIVLGIIKFTTLWIKEISVNKKYKNIKLNKQKEQFIQTKNINNNQQNNIKQPYNEVNSNPKYTEELTFKPNENSQVNNLEQK